jgi:hypothetical protein
MGIRRAAELDEHEVVNGAEPGRLDAEEVARDDPVRLGRRNSAHVGPARRGAGTSRAARSRVRTVVVLAQRPSFRSSPWTRPQDGDGRISARLGPKRYRGPVAFGDV